MFKKVGTRISGVYVLRTEVFSDLRGQFIKTFHISDFENLGLNISVNEEYYSISQKRVLRGLHFQTPPADHEKVVYCSYGKVMDVVVDIRKGSPAYGMHEVFELSSDNGEMLFIPKGCAHGFYVLSDIAVMMYKVSSVYSSENDTGILWNSVGIDWPDENPIISARDNSFVKFEDFNSPFYYKR